MWMQLLQLCSDVNGHHFNKFDHCNRLKRGTLICMHVNIHYCLKVFLILYYLIIYFFQQGYTTLINNTKDIYAVTKNYISSNCCSFYIFSKKQRKENLCFPKNIKQQLFSVLIIIRNVSWAANQDIRVISKGSCNDAENLDLNSQE